MTKIDYCALPSPTQKWKKAKPPTPSAKAAKIPATDVKQRPPKMAFCLPNRSATRPKTTKRSAIHIQQHSKINILKQYSKENVINPEFNFFLLTKGWKKCK